MDKEQDKKDSGFGPIIGSAIIIILIILGGLYFLGYTISKQKVEAPSVTPEQVNQESSTNVDQISNELDSTNIDDVDADLKEIDAQLDSVL